MLVTLSMYTEVKGASCNVSSTALSSGNLTGAPNVSLRFNLTFSGSHILKRVNERDEINFSNVYNLTSICKMLLFQYVIGIRIIHEIVLYILLLAFTSFLPPSFPPLSLPVFFFFFASQVFKIWCEFYTYNMSQFRSAHFRCSIAPYGL